ncbi:PhoX family protein [Stenoxybacter acetivorans]|uniref:PhoX family protein n=1 Tax=Stenoxybacter acetivorans TaxID=422441 RepID=UPI000568F351|nr:PhoX family phosphatase [Stenoxybacter acetivorans]
MNNKLLKHVNEDVSSNDSANPIFSDVMQTRLSRRSLLQSGTALGAAAALPVGMSLFSTDAKAGVFADDNIGKARQLGFSPVPFSSEDAVIVPKGYTAQAFYKWGDAVGIDGRMPEFKQDGSNTTQDQAVQAGMHHDGMAFFSLPLGSKNSKHGLLAMNHEYVDNGMLFKDGIADWDANKIRKSQNAMGVSVIEIRQDNNQEWQVVRPSAYARRITPHTPMRVSGPARGHDLMKTKADPRGEVILGTMQNCANGLTPWGTYLTCEENWADIFTTQGVPTAEEKRYGIGSKDEVYLWSEQDFRFDIGLTPNEPNRFGWVVEIDPYDPKSTPIKHTALGRIKHEGATVTIASDNRVVVYMGDDQVFEYIYKFISKNHYQPNNREANKRLLEEGTLYVARFDENGNGEWIPLIQGQGKLIAANGFADQGELLVKTRQAADTVGATKMDRPEWIAVDPYKNGSVYCTLTNNKDRGKDGKAGTDAANPRADNLFGHIIHWQEADRNPTALQFKWDILVLAGRHDTDDTRFKGNMAGAEFGSPDGLSFDHRGVLWIQTDVSTSTLNEKEYAGMGNNQMVATIPDSNEYRRFLTGPNGSEITGITFTPDNKTLFINIQHPGESRSGTADPANPKAISAWPDGESGGRPRSATVVITKDDGGLIGS